MPWFQLASPNLSVHKHIQLKKSKNVLVLRYHGYII